MGFLPGLSKKFLEEYPSRQFDDRARAQLQALEAKKFVFVPVKNDLYELLRQYLLGRETYIGSSLSKLFTPKTKTPNLLDTKSVELVERSSLSTDSKIQNSIPDDYGKYFTSTDAGKKSLRIFKQVLAEVNAIQDLKTAKTACGQIYAIFRKEYSKDILHPEGRNALATTLSKMYSILTKNTVGYNFLFPDGLTVFNELSLVRRNLLTHEFVKKIQDSPELMQKIQEVDYYQACEDAHQRDLSAMILNLPRPELPEIPPRPTITREFKDAIWNIKQEVLAMYAIKENEMIAAYQSQLGLGPTSVKTLSADEKSDSKQPEQSLSSSSASSTASTPQPATKNKPPEPPAPLPTSTPKPK